MPNGTYGGVRGRKTKVGRKLLRFPPTRFFDIVDCSQFYQSIDRNMTVVFFDKYPAEISVFSSCFYFAVNIENMTENHNTLKNRKLCDCW